MFMVRLAKEEQLKASQNRQRKGEVEEGDKVEVALA